MSKIPNPVEYIIERLGEQWNLTTEGRQKCREALYKSGYDTNLLMLQMMELKNNELELMFDELPKGVVDELDEIPL